MPRGHDVRMVASGHGSAPHRRLTVGVALAVVVALLVGLAIGRLTAPNGDGGQRAPAARVGPTASRDGVPVGYQHSRGGATAALLNYSVVLSRLLLDPPARRTKALHVLGTDQFVRTTAQRLTHARQALDQGPLGQGLDRGADTLYRGGPLGYRVLRYDGDTAVIGTWAFGLVANTAGFGPQMTFQTSTSTLRWQDGDWKLAGSSSRPGPAPHVDESQIVGAGAFVKAIGRLQQLRYAP